jgi:hypothetical protein
MTFVEFDVVELPEIVVSATPNEILFDFPNSGLNCLRVAGFCL